MHGQPSNLARDLLLLYASGEMTGTTVQRLAASAWADGWGRRSRLAERLKSLGQGGVHKGNITRDLLTAAREAGLMSTGARPYAIELPGSGSLGIFLPHEVLFHESQKFGDALCMAAADLGEDATCMGRLLCEWVSHEDVGYRGCASQVGGIGIHCDGVQYTSTMRAGGGRSVIVGSLNIVTARRPELRGRRHPIFVLQKNRLCTCGCQGYHTLQAIFEAVSWSMRCSLCGAAPEARHDGSPWTQEDHRDRLTRGTALPVFAVLQVRGDWEWLVQAFRFRSYSSENFCWLCDATLSAGPMCFHEFSPDAEHRRTQLSHQTYLAGCMRDGVQPSRLFCCPGLELKHIAVDSMHAGDLGAFQDAVGGLFFLEISDRQRYRNKQTGMLHLNGQLTNFYTAHPGLTKLTPLSLSQLSSGKEAGNYPTLKAKAAQTRHVTEFCLVLSYQHQLGAPWRAPFAFGRTHRLSGREAEHGALLVDMCEGMARYHRACGRVPFDAENCKAAMYRFLRAMAGLHRMWREGLPLAEVSSQPFRLRPKCHMLMHLVSDQLQLWGSPSSFWCYGDEDFVGAVKQIAARTKHPYTMEVRMAEKLMLLTGLQR